MAEIKEQFQKAKARLQAFRGEAVLHLHGQNIPDPYQHLENVKSPSTLSWISGQEELFRLFTEKYKGMAAAEEAMAVFANVPEKGIPTCAGNHYLFYYKEAGDNAVRLMISDTTEGKGRVLVDPKQAGDNATIFDVSISPDEQHITYSINDPQMYPASKSPDWERRICIKNLNTGKDLPEIIEQAGAMWWDKDGKGFTYNRLMPTGEGKMDFDMILMHHRLGDDPAQDIIHGADQHLPYGAPTNSSYRGNFLYHGSQEWFFTGGGADHCHRSLMMKDPKTGKYRTLIDEGIAEFRPMADTGNGILMWTDHNAPNGKIVLFDPVHPQPEKWETVVSESKEMMRYAFFHSGKIFGLYLHNCTHQIKIFDDKGASLGEVPLPSNTTVEFDHCRRSGLSIDHDTPLRVNDDFFFMITSYISVPAVYRYDAKKNIVTPLEDRQETPHLSNCIVERLWATSKDGTQVPMTVVRRKDTHLNGSAAVKIMGYGSGGGTLTPFFDAESMDFIRSGGILVQAHVRGGGELGGTWAAQGRLMQKGNSFDDFNACAEHLVEQKYTSPGRIIAEGQSAGGLLVLASALRAREDLYGAVIANAPAANMLGKEMEPTYYEFGNPHDSKETLDYLMSYSPLHNVQPGRKYPSILVHTGEHDWLLPGALKFIAEMQHTSPDSLTLLHVEKGFGHGPQRPDEIAMNEYPLKKAFIERSIGPIDQTAYKMTTAKTPKNKFQANR